MKRTNVHNLKEMNNERNNKEYTVYFLCNWIQNLKILSNGDIIRLIKNVNIFDNKTLENYFPFFIGYHIEREKKQLFLRRVLTVQEY